MVMLGPGVGVANDVDRAIFIIETVAKIIQHAQELLVHTVQSGIAAIPVPDATGIRKRGRAKGAYVQIVGQIFDGYFRALRFHPIFKRAIDRSG